MKIAIFGTRGIPNHYGGFEQFAEYFSVYLAEKGHKVLVYNSHNHPYKANNFKGVQIVHCYDPEYKIGTAGQFIYDLNCILDIRKQKVDIILQLGYTSSSIWHFLLPKKSIVITNMDGLEWKRTKYSKLVQKVLLFAERLAVKNSDYLVADSLGIQKYIHHKYQKSSEYIAYGAYPFDQPNLSVLERYGLQPNGYHMILARLEPENSIEILLEGIASNTGSTPVLVIGNHNTPYGNYLKSKYGFCSKIRFVGPIYQIDDLNNLRYFSELYFHGHTVGGTNPSLLEAMASKALIIAYRNEFNAAILKENAFYFETADEVNKLLDYTKKSDNLQKIVNNFEAIANEFSWEIINGKYAQFFEECFSKRGKW
ncbi:MAG: DUF1972 domain-containing protein [Flavobacterium sp.]|jgi:glycosyltransferase involved in cell wall biosynthesis|uniref:DUF1972 domain-containing protein n=1 Tax=Flavobacterium sp. TaxID=239 RepID=UPI0022BC8E58|nr:DUF1972 domain-containing protein [Flavobacterium sp.]MCZ8168361.1 DUF1972 domain-containing protein [Flavobacterium sp.]MCZ8296681.1 DUF1972 domain-containing protein [Flavobacterium sp.]